MCFDLKRLGQRSTGLGQRGNQLGGNRGVGGPWGGWGWLRRALCVVYVVPQVIDPPG